MVEGYIDSSHIEACILYVITLESLRILMITNAYQPHVQENKICHPETEKQIIPITIINLKKEATSIS